MNDPAIGSSSPHWACLMSAERMSNTNFELGEDGLEMGMESPMNGSMVDGNSSGQQMSPYAPVFYPMGSYAAQLLAQEQAAQLNSRATATRSVGDSQIYSQGQGQGGDSASSANEANCNSFGLGMDMKAPATAEREGGDAEGSGLPAQPSIHWRRQHDDNWSLGQASTSPTGQGRAQGTGSIEVAVPPRTVNMIAGGMGMGMGTVTATGGNGEWTPYSYANKPVVANKTTSPMLTAVHASRSPNPSVGPIPIPTHPSSSPNSHCHSHCHCHCSCSSCPDSMDFPSFDEFAKQLDECGVSRNEFLATLRNLLIRANEMMLPLLRGPFTRMTPVQMATYTTAILKTPPLHPSLFMPAEAQRFLSTNSWNLPPCHPHSLTPQDLARINRRPELVDAATQTDFLPTNGPWAMVAGGGGGGGDLGPLPPPTQFGFWVPLHPHPHPHAHPHPHPHAHPHQMPHQMQQQQHQHHQMPHPHPHPHPHSHQHALTGQLRFPEATGNNPSPSHIGAPVGPAGPVCPGGAGGGARYGFRLGHYSPMPCRYGPLARGRHAKHSHASENFPGGPGAAGPVQAGGAGGRGGGGGVAAAGGYSNPRQRTGGPCVSTNSEDTDMSLSFTAEQARREGVVGNNHSSSSNISSSSSISCFPNFNLPMPRPMPRQQQQRQPRRRRSTTTDCSSEDPNDSHDGPEAIEEEEPDKHHHHHHQQEEEEVAYEKGAGNRCRRPPRRVHQEMCDRMVAYVVPHESSHMQIQHQFPLDNGSVQMMQQPNTTNVNEAPRPAFGEMMINPLVEPPLVSGVPSLPEFGPTNELTTDRNSFSVLAHSLPLQQQQIIRHPNVNQMMAETPPSTNVFMHPNGPMLPIVFDVPHQQQQQQQQPQPPLAPPMTHHMMNAAMGHMPQQHMMAMMNPNMLQGPQMPCMLPSVNAPSISNGHSNILLPEFDPMPSPDNVNMPPTPQVIDDSLQQQQQ